MRLSPQILAAAGYSPWIPINEYLYTPGGVSLALLFSSNANLTAAVQYTYDSPSQSPLSVLATRAATVLTLPIPAHLLLSTVPDTVEVTDPAGNWTASYNVAGVTDQNNVTVTVANAGPASGQVLVRKYRVFTHPTLQGVTGTPPARVDGGLNFQVSAVRLIVSGYTAGSVELDVQHGKGY